MWQHSLDGDQFVHFPPRVARGGSSVAVDAVLIVYYGVTLAERGERWCCTSRFCNRKCLVSVGIVRDEVAVSDVDEGVGGSTFRSVIFAVLNLTTAV